MATANRLYKQTAASRSGSDLQPHDFWKEFGKKMLKGNIQEDEAFDFECVG